MNFKPLPLIVFVIAIFLVLIYNLLKTESPIRIGATMSESGAYSTQGIAA